MNRHLSHLQKTLIGAVAVLAPVLAIAQGPQMDSSTGTVTGTDLTSTPEAYWVLRFDLSWVDPSGSPVSFAGDGHTVWTYFDTDFGAGMRAEYRFSERLGVEVGVLGAGNVDVTSGYFDHSIGSNVEVSGFTPLTLGLNVHLTPDRAVDLYAGPLLALVMYSSVDDWSSHYVGRTNVSVDNDVGWGAILGLDVPLGSRGWMAQANLRYIDTDMKNSGGDISLNSEFDPVIYSVGFGYRF